MLRGSNLLMLIKSGGFSKVVNEVDQKYKESRKFMIAAVENGFILPYDWMEKLYKEKQPLFTDVLRHTSRPFRQYNSLLPDVRNDPKVGLTLLKRNKTIEGDKGSLALHLSNDITNKIVRKHIRTLVAFAANGHASAAGDVWDEKTVVVSLCKFNGNYYQHASSRLQTDRDVVRAALSGRASSAIICSVPLTFFEQNHDIAALAIKACSTSDWWSASSALYKHFGGDLIASKVVLMEWVRKGWEIIWLFPRFFRFSDQEVALEAIKHAQLPTYEGWVFQRLFKRLPSQKLLRDKTFVLSAVEAKPEILKFSRGGLLQDFDYMVRVAGMGREALFYLSHKEKVLDALIDCAAQVRTRLAVVDGFVIQFLGAMSIDPPQDKRAKRRRTCRGPEPRCHLRMLDVGSGLAIKKSIAEFAGVPLEADLKLLHTSLDTLQFGDTDCVVCGWREQLGWGLCVGAVCTLCYRKGTSVVQ